MQVNDVIAEAFPFILLFCFGLEVILLLRAMVNSWRVHRYLEENDPDRLEWLTGNRQFDGFARFGNIAHSANYFFGEIDNDNPTIFRWKKKIKQSLIAAVVLLILSSLLVGTLFVYIVFSSIISSG